MVYRSECLKKEKTPKAYGISIVRISLKFIEVMCGTRERVHSFASNSHPHNETKQKHLEQWKKAICALCGFTFQFGGEKKHGPERFRPRASNIKYLEEK